MKLRLTVLLGAAFLLGVLAWAQTPTTTTPSGELHPNAESAVSQQSATGKVISVSATKLVVEVDSGAQMTFTLDSATALMPAVKNLKAGDRVSVNYKSLSSGDLQVASVSLVTQPSGSSTATTTMPPPDKTAMQPDTPAPDAVTAPEPDTTTQTRPSTPYPSTSATPPSDSTTSAQPESYSTTPAPATTTDPNATSTSNALPQTASPLPVLFSLVILAALAAFTLRMARREA